MSCWGLHHHSAKHAAQCPTRGRRSSARCQASLEQELLQWAHRKGVNTDKLLVKPAEGHQLRATRSVPKGETVLSIPKQAWLTTDVVSRSPIGQAVAGLEPWLQLALFLLHTRQQRGEWHSYVASLPEPDTPLSWAAEDLELLQGAQLHSTLMGYRQFFEGLYSRLEAEVFSRDARTFDRSHFSYEGLVWAIQVVRSHVHKPLEGKDVALVPIADLVQHQRGVNAKWKVQTNVLSRGQTLTMEAAVSLQAGQRLTMDFGAERPDSALLLDYGVLDHTQPAPGFQLTLALPEGDRLYDDKADTLDINGFGETHTFLLKPGEEPSLDMLAFLRLMNLQGQDAFLMEPLFRNEVWGHLQAPVSEANEELVFSSMIDGCREALGAYVSSIDEDLALLRELSPGTRKHKAVIVRSMLLLNKAQRCTWSQCTPAVCVPPVILPASVVNGSQSFKKLHVRMGEKEALDSVSSFFEARRSRLSELEYYQERRLKRLGLLTEAGDYSKYDSFFSTADRA